MILIRNDGMAFYHEAREVDADGWDVCGNKSPVVDAEHRDEMSYEIPDDELWMTYPFLYGFSFKNKIWGRFEVSGLSEIRWRKDAFDLLVMDAGEKELIRALVEHRGASFGDVIDGKSGGTIFLLHGSPGLGKTLTAETVAEVLKKPLYSVGVGELGTSPGDLEMNLREILEIATSWDAVLLLDEADIFLEARRDSDILRNAMVGIFLRLLEYYHGVLFLTSNRAKNIDEAFVSRISIIINYGANNISTRSQVWKNILGAAGVSIHDRDIEALSRFDINGRQIKNVVRTSQTLARARGIDTDAKLISSVISKTIDSIASLKDT